MKNLLLLAGCTMLLSSCANGLAVPAWMHGDWKCTVQDDNGNPYFGIDQDRKAAADKARWQCLSGSPYKASCDEAKASHCEQLK